MVGDLFLWGFCCLKLWKRDKKVRRCSSILLRCLSAQTSRFLLRFICDVNYSCETHGDLRRGEKTKPDSMSLGTVFGMLSLGNGFEYSWDATILEFTINMLSFWGTFLIHRSFWVGLLCFYKWPVCWRSWPDFCTWLAEFVHAPDPGLYCCIQHQVVHYVFPWHKVRCYPYSSLARRTAAFLLYAAR